MGAKRFFFMIRCRLTATESRAVTCKVKSSLGCGLKVARLDLSAFSYTLSSIS